VRHFPPLITAVMRRQQQVGEVGSFHSVPFRLSSVCAPSHDLREGGKTGKRVVGREDEDEDEHLVFFFLFS